MRLKLGQVVIVNKNMGELKKGTILKVSKRTRDLAVLENVKTKERYITYGICSYVNLIEEDILHV